MRVLPGPTKSNTVLAWSPDSRFLVAGGIGDGVMFWDVDASKPGRRILTRGHGGKFIRFCPVSGRLYVGFQSEGFFHWNPETGDERRVPWEPEYISCNGLAVAADGRTVVLERGRVTVGYSVADDGTPTRVWSRPDDGWSHGFAFRRDPGELFGLVARERSFTPFQQFEWIVTDTGEELGSFTPAEGGRVKQWVLAPEGDRVAWLSERGLYLRRLDDPTTLELPAAEGEFRRGLAFHPGGRMLAYTTGNTVRLIDADTLNEIRALDWNTGRARAVAFSPDGLRCAVSGEGGRGWVTVFDVE